MFPVFSSGLPSGVYALCDDGVRTELSLEEKAERILSGGVRVLQLRAKRTPLADALRSARLIVSMCRRQGAICLINDRPDLALLAGASGVHLGEEDLTVECSRKVLGDQALIGVTVRDLEGAHRALVAGASYVGLGPIFKTRSKQVGVAPLGLSFMEKICRHAPLPVVAIAGIGLSNIEEVARSGAQGAAVLSDLLCADDISEHARLLCEAFARGQRRRNVEAG